MNPIVIPQQTARRFVLSNPELFEQVRAELRKRGPLENRDFKGNAVNPIHEFCRF